MSFGKYFINTLNNIFGVERQDTSELKARVDEIATEVEQIKEAIAVLIMTNPNIKIIGADNAQNDDDMFVSGSRDGPDGRLLN